jgi:hypothetical protein
VQDLLRIVGSGDTTAAGQGLLEDGEEDEDEEEEVWL